MTKAQAIRQFREFGGVIKGDVIYTRENWNNYTDSLCKCGEISDRQYNTWTNPF